MQCACTQENIQVSFPQETLHPYPGCAPKHVAPVTPHSMPKREREPQPLVHGLAIDHLITVVVAKCQWVARVWAFIVNVWNAGKVGGG